MVTYLSKTGKAYTKTDRCWAGTKRVLEYYCKDGEKKFRFITCGITCSDGACVTS